jgi:hypothetical protein
VVASLLLSNSHFIFVFVISLFLLSQIFNRMGQGTSDKITLKEWHFRRNTLADHAGYDVGLFVRGHGGLGAMKLRGCNGWKKFDHDRLPR